MTITVDDLKSLYATTRSDEELQVFLDIALLVVDEDLRPNCVMTEDRYDVITRYLALHFLAISDMAASGSSSGGELKKSKLGESEETYEVMPTDLGGFQSTKWGQLALALDKCGILMSLQIPKLKAQFRVV